MKITIEKQLVMRLGWIIDDLASTEECTCDGECVGTCLYSKVSRLQDEITEVLIGEITK